MLTGLEHEQYHWNQTKATPIIHADPYITSTKRYHAKTTLVAGSAGH
jgi:hypothetical protein